MSNIFKDMLKFGVAKSLDLPTEGLTGSGYAQPANGYKTEQTKPINATPSIGGGNNGGGFSVIWLVAGLGVLAIAKAIKVI